MADFCYVNGLYVTKPLAMIHVEDRGYQFADGVYEVMRFKHNVILDEAEHFARLEKSLLGLKMHMPMSQAALRIIIQELWRRNKVQEGCIYLQMTRGVAKRNHAFPKRDTAISVVVYLFPLPKKNLALYEEGGGLITVPDMRWSRCDIKSICLLPNILLKQQAVDAKVDEAILLGEGDIVREGSSTNLFMVDKDERLHTHPATHEILPGITRFKVIEIAKAQSMTVIEEPFDRSQLYKASEVFITSTTKGIFPIAKIDDKVIGSCGLITKRLMTFFDAYIEQNGKVQHVA